jgi:hypothetical protein
LFSQGLDVLIGTGGSEQTGCDIACESLSQTIDLNRSQREPLQEHDANLIGIGSVTWLSVEPLRSIAEFQSG